MNWQQSPFFQALAASGFARPSVSIRFDDNFWVYARKEFLGLRPGYDINANPEEFEGIMLAAGQTLAKMNYTGSA